MQDLKAKRLKRSSVSRESVMSPRLKPRDPSESPEMIVADEKVYRNDIKDVKPRCNCKL